MRPPDFSATILANSLAARLRGLSPALTVAIFMTIGVCACTVAAKHVSANSPAAVKLHAPDRKPACVMAGMDELLPAAATSFSHLTRCRERSEPCARTVGAGKPDVNRDAPPVSHSLRRGLPHRSSHGSAHRDVVC